MVSALWGQPLAELDAGCGRWFSGENLRGESAWPRGAETCGLPTVEEKSLEVTDPGVSLIGQHDYLGVCPQTTPHAEF